MIGMRSSSTVDEIRRLMETHNLTPRDVAEMLHVTRQAVYAWFSGRNPAPYMAAELLRRLVERP
jgi:DNA-binding transcriptional regulator YiaG